MDRSFFFALLLVLPIPLSANWLSAPVKDSPSVNQLKTSGNACGPACLLDAFRSGSKKWRSSIARIEGTSDKDKIINIIKAHGRKASRLDATKARWNTRQGINAPDLADMANEMRAAMWMGTVKQELFFPGNRESSSQLLQRTHRNLTRSLEKGLPPILSVRRMALRAPARNSAPVWLTVKRHFVVLTGLPAQLPKNAESFQVTYHDPWGGKKLTGTVRLPKPEERKIGTLVVDFTGSNIGRNLVRRGEQTRLSLSSAIGLF